MVFGILGQKGSAIQVQALGVHFLRRILLDLQGSLIHKWQNE